MPEISSLSELRLAARKNGPKRVAVVMADDDVALHAAADATELGLVHPILIGDARAIHEKISALGLHALAATAEIIHCAEPATLAAHMAGQGAADMLLKGHMRSDELLHAVLDRNAGLRTGRLLSDVLIYEDNLSGVCRLVAITDGGLVIAPNLEQKKQIVLNAIEVMHCLGFKRPRIALMSASEMVSDSMVSTTDARTLTQMGQAGAFGDAEVFGPLALDNALLVTAAQAKGISSPVAGRADCMVVPTIEAGNLLGKAAKYFTGSQCAHVVVGAKVPVLIPSRVESADDKVNSIALGVLYGVR